MDSVNRDEQKNSCRGRRRGGGETWRSGRRMTRSFPKWTRLVPYPSCPCPSLPLSSLISVLWSSDFFSGFPALCPRLRLMPSVLTEAFQTLCLEAFPLNHSRYAAEITPPPKCPLSLTTVLVFLLVVDYAILGLGFSIKMCYLAMTR